MGIILPGFYSIPQEFEEGWTKESEELVEFRYLETLEFRFTGEDGREHTSWAIYAHPVDEENDEGEFSVIEAPGEGYACVDDTARVAQVYLSYYERTGDLPALEKAKQALDFLLYMTTDRGEFYNFIDKRGRINRKGKTSVADMDWWTARAFHALGKGLRVIGEGDGELSEQMREAYLATLEELFQKREEREGDPDLEEIYRELDIAPGDLINNSGTITSLVVLGLVEGYQAGLDSRIGDLITAYCNSLLKVEERSLERYPYFGFHYPTLSNPDMVHLYGNRQVQALCEAGYLLGNSDWVASAEREANFAYPRVLTSWGLPFAYSPDPEEFPQLAYSAETTISNLIALYRVTGKEEYAILGGLFTAWFFGDNPHEVRVCLPDRGCCFDGIDPQGLSANAGAESVIESLLTLEGISNTPALDYMYFKSEGEGGIKPSLVTAESFSVVSGDFDWVHRVYSGGMERRVIRMNSSCRIGVSLGDLEPVEYKVYAAYQCMGSRGEGAFLRGVIGDESFEVPLEVSKKEYHHRIVCLGRFMPEKGEEMRIELENGGERSEIVVSSIIAQPAVQEKSWCFRDRRVSVSVDVFSDDERFENWRLGFGSQNSEIRGQKSEVSGGFGGRNSDV